MYEQISENNRNTVLLVAFFSVFVLALAWILGEVWFAGGGTLGIIVGFLFLLVFVGINYFFADKIVLSISGAREVKKGEYPYLFNIIEGLAIAAGIPKPKAYVIEDTALNAFATGRNPEHGIVVVTTGILKTLDRQELGGVIAHEMSHIKNYDIRLMTLVVVFVGLSALLSDILLRSVLWGKHDRRDGKMGLVILAGGVILAILTPFIAMLIKFAISRQREYLADASGALLSRNPEGLASALEKISGDKEVLEAANKATAHLYIDNPLKNRKGAWFDSMFSTHPPIKERVARLRGM